MNVQEVEARIEARITGIEDQESRLGEWLECLRKLEGIATQWQSEPVEESVIETQPVVKEAALVSEIEAVNDPLEQAGEQCVADNQQPQMAEDPFDELRRRLAGKSECKSQPVFNTGLLFGASA